MSETRDEAVERRERRRRRLARTAGGNEPKGFFANPISTVLCMGVALVAILAYWQGAPRWALLALGIGAVVVIVLGAALWKSRRKKER